MEAIAHRRIKAVLSPSYVMQLRQFKVSVLVYNLYHSHSDILYIPVS